MVLIIAEAGVNHNGSIKIAKELIDAAVTYSATEMPHAVHACGAIGVLAFFM